MKSYLSKCGNKWILIGEDGSDIFETVNYDYALAKWSEYRAAGHR